MTTIATICFPAVFKNFPMPRRQPTMNIPFVNEFFMHFEKKSTRKSLVKIVLTRSEKHTKRTKYFYDQ